MSEIAEKALRVLAGRRAVYMHKHQEADPFAEDTYTRWDAHRLVVEAFDIAMAEVARELGVPEPEPLLLD